MDNNLPKDPPTPPSPQPPSSNNPPSRPLSPNSLNQPTDPSNLPPSVQVIHGGGGESDDKDDDNLAEFKLKNPFSKFFNNISRFIKNQNVKITIPAFTFIGLGVALAGGGGIITGAIIYFFPHNSPILHREVMYQGLLQKTPNGLILTLPNSDLYTLRPKVKSSINFQSLTDGPVLVKGNLTVEKFVIDVEEIIPLNLSDSLPAPTSLPGSFAPTQSEAQSLPETPNLPELYQKLTWETAQKKILTFTSGRRRIEQEGVYLESAKLNSLPHDFINYYISQLQDSGFKQTLNKIDPDGITTSFEKKGIFLTFGVKNIYKGSGDTKQIVGYKAFIEHN